MRQNVILFGAILAALHSILGYIMVIVMYNDPEFKSYDVLGYIVLLLMYSVIFFGIRNYRNKELDGQISFGHAFKTGIFITLFAGTVYVILWVFIYYLFIPDFMEVFTQHVLYQTTTEEELLAKKEEMEQFSKLYENPIWVVLLTYAEVIPTGLVVTLISSLILRKKKSTSPTN